MKKNSSRYMVVERIAHVGLDVHKRTISVALLTSESTQAVTWELDNGSHVVRRLLRQLARRTNEKLKLCYEAGPCGYSLQRELAAAEVDCIVVAPSLIPRKPGQRIKTDRRDAIKLTEALRAGTLTEVHAPTRDQEAARGLSRCREDASRDQKVARQRLGKFLDMRGLRWSGRSHWTMTHHQWLCSLRFEQAEDQYAFDHYLSKVQVCTEQLSSVTKAFEKLSLQQPYARPVSYLRCLYGVDTVTAMSLVVELFDIGRFPSARQMMAYLGLVPSEHSSGGSERRGSITKAGNGHVRRLLVEAAHHCRRPVRISAPLQRRRRDQPPQILALANRAQQRLNSRYWHLTHRGKRPNTVVVALARELVGFVWAALHMANQDDAKAAA